jgi:hypothetical protein
LTELWIRSGLNAHPKLEPFWEALRDSVAPAGRLRSLVVKGNFVDAFSKSNVEPLGQLVGSR